MTYLADSDYCGDKSNTRC